MDRPETMTGGGWAAAATAGVGAFFALIRVWLRRKKPAEPEWLISLRNEQARARSEHSVMRDELNATRRELAELRDRQQHDASVQIAMLTRIDTALARADLQSMQQQIERHAGRLDRIERHLENQS